jgi:3',5'-cyclic AMP phosphodiesterase CpdA
MRVGSLGATSSVVGRGCRCFRWRLRTAARRGLTLIRPRRLGRAHREGLAAQQSGAQLFWVMGNDDNRAVLRRFLLDEAPSTAPLDRVRMIDGLRIITLDTSVPGYHHGEISGRQLDWPADELATPAPDGTILVLHHPPIPSVLDLTVTVELRGRRGRRATTAATRVHPGRRVSVPRRRRRLARCARHGERT